MGVKIWTSHGVGIGTGLAVQELIYSPEDVIQTPFGTCRPRGGSFRSLWTRDVGVSDSLCLKDA